MKKITIYSFEFVKKVDGQYVWLFFENGTKMKIHFEIFFANNDKAVESVEKGPKIALKKNRKNTLIF